MMNVIFFHASTILISYGVIEVCIYLYLMIVEVFSIIPGRIYNLLNK